MVIRLVIADDDWAIRAGLRSVLDTAADLAVVAEADTGRKAVDAVLAHQPDVVLLDIRMPDLDGLEAAAEISRLAPATRRIIVTTFGEDHYLTRALELGVDGFLLKSGDPHDLISGIRAVSHGGACLAPPLTRSLMTAMTTIRAQQRTRDARQAHLAARLTRRELDVLAHVGRGLSNHEIAQHLHVSEGTIKTHVSALLTTLQLKNRVQLAILAQQAGIRHDNRR
jgi:DNA-binding NarL/FixJ family response regulator